MLLKVTRKQKWTFSSNKPQSCVPLELFNWAFWWTKASIRKWSNLPSHVATRHKSPWLVFVLWSRWVWSIVLSIVSLFYKHIRSVDRVVSKCLPNSDMQLLMQPCQGEVKKYASSHNSSVLFCSFQNINVINDENACLFWSSMAYCLHDWNDMVAKSKGCYFYRMRGENNH